MTIYRVVCENVEQRSNHKIWVCFTSFLALMCLADNWTTPDKKATALLKLVYLEMFGYDMSWASFHVLEVMSSSKYLPKRAGYLGAVQSFRTDTEILMLATNLLKKVSKWRSYHDHFRCLIHLQDLASPGVPNISLPLITLPNIITPSLAMSLVSDVLSRISHTHAVVRKKAIVCLYRLALVYPEALNVAWPKIKDRLMDEDEDNSVTTAAINVVCELGWRRPHDLLPLAPRLFDLLVDGGNNWMAIKIIKLVCLSPWTCSSFLTMAVCNFNTFRTTTCPKTSSASDEYYPNYFCNVFTLRVYQRHNTGWYTGRRWGCWWDNRDREFVRRETSWHDSHWFWPQSYVICV